jgi:hypothetical protein
MAVFPPLTLAKWLKISHWRGLRRSASYPNIVG